VIGDKSASESDRFQTQNLNPTEADFSWLHHIPNHHSINIIREQAYKLTNKVKNNLFGEMSNYKLKTVKYADLTK